MEDRYSAFLNTARSKSATSEKDVEQNPEYAALKQAYEKTYEDSKRRADDARKAVDDASARLLAVQSVFTDRRAYVNALSYEIETSTSASSKASKQKESDAYKAEKATVEFPDGSKRISLPRNWRRPTTRSATSARS
jgi:predicted  nucleic acid-binding Zn-ribbon protein